jgi:hypothetical protein
MSKEPQPKPEGLIKPPPPPPPPPLSSEVKIKKWIRNLPLPFLEWFKQ